MKKVTWMKHHKWLGLVFCFFLLMFCVSGIILNHRHMWGKVNVSRAYLPHSYQFSNWNNGLMRGTLRLPDHQVLLYGAGGVYLTDSLGKSYKNFNEGMPTSADSRNIRNVVVTRSGHLFAIAPYDVYVFNKTWQRIPLGSQSHVNPTRFTDIAVRGDSVIFLSRSNVYVADSVQQQRLFANASDIKHVKCYQLKAPAGYDKSVTLFRTVWMLHSGDLFGVPGKVFMDCMGLLLIFLCCSGIVIWITKKWKMPRVFKWNFKWHEKLGRWTIILTMFVAISGWALRPPLLIALVKCSTKPIPFTSLDSDNAWNDKLRMIVYDDHCHDWVLSTSDGFYSLASFDAVPEAVTSAPPVSVMGINVMQHRDADWLIGSFSGLYLWNRDTGVATDYFTGEAAPKKAGSPFGKIAVTGYSGDFPTYGPVVNTYMDGVLSDRLPQPESLSSLPMSVWSLALEVHTGRIYTFMCGAETLIYIFIAGIICFWLFWSGWKLRKK